MNLRETAFFLANQAHATRVNVVREAPHTMMSGFATTKRTTPSTTTSTTTVTTTTASTTEYIPRGCVSKRSECTQDVEKCRTFVHRSVAQVFCRCSPICIEVANAPASATASTGEFNMQCSAAAGSGAKPGTPRSLQHNQYRNDTSAATTDDIPFYCQFIPFFSYN